MNNDNFIVGQQPKKKWHLFVIIGVGLLLITVLILFFFLLRKQDVYILIAPESAEIEIDGKKYSNGRYSLPVGNHHIVISADGFSYSEYDFDLTKDEPKYIYDYLEEKTKTYSEKDYEILSLIADDDYINEKISTRLRAKTIFEQLPFSDVETGITITDGTEKTDCEDGSMCIEIIGSGDQSEESALDVIRKIGYDPNNYELFYEGIKIEEEDDE